MISRNLCGRAEHAPRRIDQHRDSQVRARPHRLPPRPTKSHSVPATELSGALAATTASADEDARPFDFAPAAHGMQGAVRRRARSRRCGPRQ